MDRVVREQWAKRVEGWKDSGLSAKEFAAELGINARSLSWWRWCLAKGKTVPPEKERPRRRRPKRSSAITKPVGVSPMTFVEMAGPVVTDALEVVLPTTVRICVRPGFDDTTLSRLLDVLEHRR